MKIEELTVMADLCHEVCYNRNRMNELCAECKSQAELEKEIETLRARLKFASDAAEENGRRLVEKTKECEALGKKMYALANTVNLIIGWQKAKKLRVFMRDYEKAVRSCIALNDIVLKTEWR